MLVYGGPKLGKTSLLLHLRGLLEQERESGSGNGPVAEYLDLRDEESRARFVVGQWGQPVDSAPDRSVVLLLDNCDALLPSVPSYRPAQATVWAGGRAWRDFVWSGGLDRAPLPVPLAVLLNGEARSLVTPDLAPHQVDAVLAYGGTHPYVLTVLRAHLIAEGPKADLAHAIRAVRAQLAPFFLACLQELKEPTERALLEWLITQAKPMNPRDAAHALGQETIKSTADVLCFLGLISRWNLHDGAVLHANCRIFNDWYLAHSKGK
ncbi:MAG TPA: hypothetical protein VE222_11725 [Nitrospiraceae bacterium]|nr:hypothetical protein [Nitrospiraceae bacterium]